MHVSINTLEFEAECVRYNECVDRRTDAHAA